MSVLSGITYTWTLQQAKLYFRKLFLWHSKRVRPCCKHKSFCVVICFFTIWPKDITVYPINSHFRQKCLAVDTTTNSAPTDAFDVKNKLNEKYLPKRSLSLSRSLLDASKFGRLDVITVLLQSVMVGEISFLIRYEALYNSILGVEVVVIHMQSWNWRTIGFSYGRASGYLIFFFLRKKKDSDAHC